jgi:hypothetical protein
MLAEALRCWGIERADGTLDRFVTNFYEDCRMSVQDGERVVRLVAKRVSGWGGPSIKPRKAKAVRP